MKKYHLLLLLSVFVLPGCASFGPTVLIETPEPAEDFVVLCEWYSSALVLHGGAKRNNHKVFITASGKEVDCGMSIWGGRSNVSIMHPLYAGGDWNDEKDGVKVVRPKTKLQILDQLKKNFEAGVWDKYKNPGSEYARSLVGCGFPHQYLDYYSEVKNVDKAHFKALYHEPILECKKRVIPIFNKYLSRAYTGKRPSPEESMNNLWNSKGWKKYE